MSIHGIRMPFWVCFSCLSSYASTWSTHPRLWSIWSQRLCWRTHPCVVMDAYPWRSRYQLSLIDKESQLSIILPNKQHRCFPFQHLWFYWSIFYLFIYYSLFICPVLTLPDMGVTWNGCLRGPGRFSSRWCWFFLVPLSHIIFFPEHVAYVGFHFRPSNKCNIRWCKLLFILSYVLFSFVSDLFVEFVYVLDLDMVFKKLLSLSSGLGREFWISICEHARDSQGPWNHWLPLVVIICQLVD